jgi:hypothetical protein
VLYEYFAFDQARERLELVDLRNHHVQYAFDSLKPNYTYLETRLNWGVLHEYSIMSIFCLRSGCTKDEPGCLKLVDFLNLHVRFPQNVSLRAWLLLYAHRHRSILGVAGHIILTPANLLMVMGLKIWSLSNPGSNQRLFDHWPTSLPTALTGPTAESL